MTQHDERGPGIAANGGPDSGFVLRLYVAGKTGRTCLAVEAVNELQAGRPDVDMEIVDVLERPDLAEAGRVLATPTLVRLHPLPELRLVGGLSSAEDIRLRLGLGAPRPATREEGT